MSKILIIDGNHACHRAFHSMARMSFAGRGTGAIFGFLNILQGNINKFKPKKVYVCWDDGRNPKRLEILPGYKKREPKLGMDYESFHKQKRTLQVMCHALGIPQLVGEDCEADDFIYALVKRKTKKPKNKIVIGTGDKDFRALVTNNVLISDNKLGLITPLNFKKLFGINPDQYVHYLALMGDDSDKIPGVPGFGEKTTLKFLRLFYNYYQFIIAKEKTKEKLHPKQDLLLEIWKRNLDLIDLKQFDDKFGPFPLIYYKDDKKPEKNFKKYKKICSKYGIRKFASDNFLSRIP